MRRDVFQALADPTRRQIMLSLVNEKKKINALAEQFEMSRQAVSLHLKFLQECGVITVHQEGRERYCQLESKKLKEAVDWFTPFKALMEERFDRMEMYLGKLKKSKNKNGRHQ